MDTTSPSSAGKNTNEEEIVKPLPMNGDEQFWAPKVSQLSGMVVPSLESFDFQDVCVCTLEAIKRHQ